MEIVKGAKSITEFDMDLYFKTVEKMTLFEGVKIIVTLLNGTEIDPKSNKVK